MRNISGIILRNQSRIRRVIETRLQVLKESEMKTAEQDGLH